MLNCKPLANYRQGLVVVLLTSASLLHVTGAEAKKLSLAGKKYEVDLTEMGKTTKDTLTFSKKEFESMQCRQYGFKPSKYKLTGTPDSIYFESTAKSKKEGVNKWTGYVKGPAINVTQVWEKKGQPNHTYLGTGKEMEPMQTSSR